ncbi:MAG: SpoIVB peptidase S55 domain-containing protein, partial [Planctomycetia bacterium]
MRILPLRVVGPCAFALRLTMGLATLVVAGLPTIAAAAELRRGDYWNVDDLRPGMKGYGLTVLRGCKRERFDVELISVMKNASPGQDMILARFAGLDLEKTGVIAGMSGSPVFIDDKLVGAVAFTWSFNTEPIGGITPFTQMVAYANPPSRRLDWVTKNADRPAPDAYLVDRPLPAAGGSFRGDRTPVGAGAGGLVPIATPVAVSGLTPDALAVLEPYLTACGMVPVVGGEAGPALLEGKDRPKIEPGGAMAVGLVLGDVSVTAVGTVTHVVGDRVFGFGHPFSSMGKCRLPLLTAYIHAVIPRQTVSSKMGSAVDVVGCIDSDVSTCVAGWLGDTVEMIPVVNHVSAPGIGFNKTVRCSIVPDRNLVGPLAMTALGSCVGLDGQAPAELTTRVQVTVDVEGRKPLSYEDVLSGPEYGGNRGVMRVYAPVANLLSLLGNNEFHRPKIKGVECKTEIIEERRSARVLSAKVVQPLLTPGGILRVRATLEPFRAVDGSVETCNDNCTEELTLELPADLP